MDNYLQHKRYKITIIAILLLTLFGIAGIVFNFETAMTVAVGGIPTITVAYIAGDSYRQSNFDNYKETFQRETYERENYENGDKPGSN